MKIALTVGHSMLKNGNITSANGVINEYKYNKELAPIIVKYLKQLGHDADLIICPERKFTKSIEEKNCKLNIVNSRKYDLVVELHLNASSSLSAKGVEVLYISAKGKAYAKRVQAKLNTLFSSRGVKHRDNLYMLTKTKPAAIMLETFFCTNQEDCNIGKDKDKIARLIAEGIANKSIPKTKTEPKPNTSNNFLTKVTADALNIRKGPSVIYKKNGVIRDKGTYTITEKKGSWGKLKSGVGWISLKYTKKA
jgi:N-acetylmuramoyl-L-alanine amidase